MGSIPHVLCSVEESLREVDAEARLLDLLQTMRGFPPLQIFILGLAFGLLAVPLAQLTGGGSHHHEEAMANAAEVKGSDEHPEGEHKHVEVAAVIRLRYAHKPLTVSLKQEGHELLGKLDLAASPVEVRGQIEVSHEGNELELAATWPPGTTDTALTLEIEPDGFETRSETRWSSDAALNEILTLTW